jgi:hypothetical protein
MDTSSYQVSAKWDERYMVGDCRADDPSEFHLFGCTWHLELGVSGKFLGYNPYHVSREAAERNEHLLWRV